MTFLCFYADAGEAAQRETMLAHLRRLFEQCRYVVPSLSPDDARFDASRYWLGPVWAIVNYLVYTGLYDTGHAEEATRIAADTRDLLQTAGFMEYFDPMTGEGLGGDTFSWTAAMWLAWLRDVPGEAVAKSA